MRWIKFRWSAIFLFYSKFWIKDETRHASKRWTAEWKKAMNKKKTTNSRRKKTGTHSFLAVNRVFLFVGLKFDFIALFLFTDRVYMLVLGVYACFFLLFFHLFIFCVDIFRISVYEYKWIKTLTEITFFSSQFFKNEKN